MAPPSGPVGRGGGNPAPNNSKAHSKPPGKSNKANLPPLDVSLERKKSLNSSIDDDDVESMLKGMRNSLPTPLTAMAPTPRVESFDEMGAQRHKPVYAPSFPFPGLPSAADLDPKPTSKPGASSSSDSSSDSESDKPSESDEEAVKNEEGFDLGSIIRATKNSPRVGSMSDRSTKPTPSPRDPTPSPSPYIAPSPSGQLPLPSPSGLLPGGLPCPAPLSPLSSPPPPSPQQRSPTKLKTPENRKLKKQDKVLGSSDEDEVARTPVQAKSKTKQIEKKKTPSRRKSTKAALSKGTISSDDSDSDGPVVSKRSSSTSPVKRAKPSPGQGRNSRPSSSSTTPVRSGRGSSSALPPPMTSHLVAQTHPSPLKRSQTNVSSNLHLSADSDDEEDEVAKVVPDKPSPAPDTAKKNSIKSRIFGPMLSKGREGGKGKGKGKGGNNGGITVVYKEEDDSSVSRDKPESPHLSSPAQRDLRDSVKASPATRDFKDVNSRSSPSVEREKVLPMRESRANRENSANFGNRLADDLDVSPSEDEEETTPAVPSKTSTEPSSLVNPSSRFSNSHSISSRSSPAVSSSPASLKRRPSLIIGIQFDRLGKTFAQFQNRLGRLQQAARLTRKPSNKECWITSGDERSGGSSKAASRSSKLEASLTSRKRKVSEGEGRVGGRQVPQHRKVTERTVESRASPALSAGRGSPALAHSRQSPAGEIVSDVREDQGEESRERKRRDRGGDISGDTGDATLVKRLRPEVDGGRVELGDAAYVKSEAVPYIKGEQAYKMQESGSAAVKKSEASLGGGFSSSGYSGVGEGMTMPPGVEGCLPGQSAWPGYVLMPPPTHPPTQRVYYSYFERRHQDEAFEDEDNVVEDAKRLKHEADTETNLEIKCHKYLQAIMLFSISASRTESLGDKINAYNMYDQTLHLIKYVMKLTNSKNAKKDTDLRLVVMSLRAQSLLNLRLYKMKRHELKDYQRTIQDVLAKSGEEEGDQQQQAGQISPTPSPAGSEGSNCSKSSGYTSSGEQRLPGVLTPPTAPPICLSIPKNVMQNQYNFCSYLSQCHELWEQADLYVSRGQCEDFFIQLDQECGPLTLHSSLKDLVYYTRRGLRTLSASPSEEAANVAPFFHPPGPSEHDHKSAMK